jgi:hypothetical protein
MQKERKYSHLFWNLVRIYACAREEESYVAGRWLASAHEPSDIG